MLDTRDILETIDMIQHDNLDIRTVTMGISLLDCIDSDIDAACGKVYEKITRLAKDLVPVCESIEKELGIPIINKRISVTPIAMIAAACRSKDVVKFALTLEKAAKTVGVNFIGGYSALVQKGICGRRPGAYRKHPRSTECNRAYMLIGKHRLHQSRHQYGRRCYDGQSRKKAAELTADRDCIGAAKLVVFCNAPEDNPFMAGAFHGVGEPDCEVNVGVSGPGVVRAALAKSKDLNLSEVADLIKRTAFKITRMGQLVAMKASERLGVPFGIVDLSLAPTPAVGDSVAHILEEIGLEQCGCCGTTACLAMLNDAVKKGGVMASSHVGGLSGAFIPVTEDAGMISAARSGVLKIEKLEAMTAVCSVGLDMINIPGDTPAEVISAIIADEAAIGMINTKTTAVRVIPAIGKVPGDELSFGGLLGSGPVMPVSTLSPAKFISRGGRIPAPIQSLKN